MRGIERIKQATYTKVFLQFPNRFWFDTEVSEIALPSPVA